MELSWLRAYCEKIIPLIAILLTYIRISHGTPSATSAAAAMALESTATAEAACLVRARLATVAGVGRAVAVVAGPMGAATVATQAAATAEAGSVTAER